ncbi:MAG: glycoside hydrolase family 3 C-terminal domain-containing protein [Lachnospiraceae bacterium]|nr:glycoside hydrolase family 3 C-terminal domain-containing protein [Lachnospiraceae bacterium]
MDNRAVAKKIAGEAIVLLKNNEHLLPFPKGQKAAFFGRAQIDTVYSGNGSGAAHKSGCKTILEECEKKGICAEHRLKEYYAEQIAKDESTKENEFDWADIGKVIASGAMYEIFGKYHAPIEEYEISEEQMKTAGQYTDTAVLVLGRNSGGEECDRHLQGDYYLTDSEKDLTEQVCGHFEKVVLILNVNGLVDLSWAEDYPQIKSILFAGILGEEGAAALAEILTGTVNPSGRLAFTIAREYGDYPAARHFSWDKENEESLLTYESYGLSAEENGSTGYAKSPVTVYYEDIYAGYRYFDTFAKEPLYAFGYGLSYTEFEIKCLGAVKGQEGIEVRVCIRNIGNTAGKEVVQLYLANSNSAYEHAFQELKGFEKTEFIQPGEEEQLCITVPWKDWSSYDEEKAAYLIRQGDYRILIGNSSRNTKVAALVRVEQDILMEQCTNRLGIKECNRVKLEFLTCLGKRGESIAQDKVIEGNTLGKILEGNSQEEMIEGNTLGRMMPEQKPGENTSKWDSCVPEISINPEDVKVMEHMNVPETCDSIREKVKNLSVEQLAALCVGYGPGTPFAAFREENDPETIYDRNGKPITTNSHPIGYNGYVSPAIEEAGIYSVSYKDGPAGIGEMAWPSEMLMACAFNKKMWYEFGNAVGAECEKQQVDVWLAPAVNLLRHPLGGRNFEYFSEDPYLTGICACEVTKGVQRNHPVLVCPKHFAVNEQETFRRGSSNKHYDAADSILSERAAREIYLKPFEMLVREADVACLMTSFNKINGVFAAGNADLCTHILKEEWGYRGVVVTDWGDMDVVVDGADAVAAGNDVVMPGGPPVIMQILQGYQEGRVSRGNLEVAVGHLLYMTEKISDSAGH